MKFLLVLLVAAAWSSRVTSKCVQKPDVSSVSSWFHNKNNSLESTSNVECLKEGLKITVTSPAITLSVVYQAGYLDYSGPAGVPVFVPASSPSCRQTFSVQTEQDAPAFPIIDKPVPVHETDPFEHLFTRSQRAAPVTEFSVSYADCALNAIVDISDFENVYAYEHRLHFRVTELLSTEHPSYSDLGFPTTTYVCPVCEHVVSVDDTDINAVLGVDQVGRCESCQTALEATGDADRTPGIQTTVTAGTCRQDTAFLWKIHSLNYDTVVVVRNDNALIPAMKTAIKLLPSPRQYTVESDFVVLDTGADLRISANIGFDSSGDCTV